MKRWVYTEIFKTLYILFKLKAAFGDMNHGTKIVSTKEFCPVNFKINERNAGKDIGCMMNVSGSCLYYDVIYSISYASD